MRFKKHYSTGTSALGMNFNAKKWCAFVALLTALTFISLVSTAVTHYHTTVQETQDCSICSVVADKIGGVSLAPALIVTQFFMLFVVVAITLSSASYVNSELFPPGCGPPAGI